MQRNECSMGQNGLPCTGLLKGDLKESKDFDFPKFFQREIQEFHELIYWPQVEVAPSLEATRTTGIWPFTSETTRTQAPRKSHSVRFRLPNFVDGISELDAKVYTSVSIERQRRSQNESPFSFKYIDVTEQFTQNLKIVNGKEGILESSIIIDAPMNQDQMLDNNIYWDITRLYLTTGWQWSVHEGIQLPMHYHDYWIADGWEVDKVGGKQVLKLN